MNKKHVATPDIIIDVVGYGALYTFSAKEKDDETQYSYFGARYYDSDLSVWLSVDPMSVKYPSTSPYMYVAGNPIVLSDPNGEEWVDEAGNSKWDQNANDGKGDYTEYASNNDKSLMDKVRQTDQGQQQFDKLVSSDQKIQINFNEEDLITEKDGSFVLGHTDNTTKKLSYEKGEVSATVKESKITVYIRGIDKFVKDMESYEMKMGDKSIPGNFDFWDIITLVTGHEIEHSTDENWSLSLGGKDFETPAYKITYKMIEELTKNK